MEKSQRCNKDTNTNIGFCLLPSELIQNILFHLCIPEIIRMKLLNKFVLNTISDQSFIRQLNHGSQRDTWIFVYTRRWRRDNGVLHGFSNRSVRWFKIPVAEILTGEVFPGEDLYLLTASGPRGTSSWRRSGMKLVPDPSNPSHFRFMFAEMVNNRPVLFTYHSNTTTWTTKEAEEVNNWGFKKNNNVFLSLSNRPHESIVMSVDDGSMMNRVPSILRPRMNQDAIRGCPSSVGFSRNDLESQLLHIHGDDYKVVIGLDTIELSKMKRMKSLEVWKISSNGEKWELVSRAPSEVISNKLCGVMMGCLERRLGVIRVALMTNREGLWNIIWLDYDKEKDKWEWVPLPHCRFLQGSNMAGISFSSGLTFSL
ncbi:PREDICTED: uncharacterized protein LOC106324801 isoform X2 [Brassica oleracea var. oleracea]|uniref:uncharacterized protein LOC106324801 isoform X2 n=1 Tax=Brassica oleracea var. oleracea TaxID=109376 RepID=UPI0006A72E83|nr:PREDICTED: uncharacterized protein LOC106324801 isoform X2 [Brassica oleracea var. oleracea]